MSAASVAILGAGHGGCAAAADLTNRGFSVRLHARNAERLAPLRARGGIEARGVAQGLFPIDMMTTNVAEAVSGADLIMLVVPSAAHAHYARSLRRCSTAASRSSSIPDIPAAGCISCANCVTPAIAARSASARR